MEQTMIERVRGSARFAAVVVGALALAGCSMNNTRSAVLGTSQATPVPNSTMQTASLPAIGQQGTAAPGLSGQPVLGGQTVPAGQPGVPTPGATTQVAVASPTLEPLGTPGAGVRDLSGGLSIDKLLGGWTIVSGAQQCRLNLTYTAKSGTSRYRASAPTCQISGLATVASWQLTGTQVQLFDEGGAIVASLILSGSRFTGMGQDGSALSMVS